METATIQTPVSLTPGAIAAVRKLMAASDFDATQALRVGVKGGGCSGMTYILGFDHKDENDNSFTIEGIPCIMNKSHEIYLYGMQVDWQDGLNKRLMEFMMASKKSTLHEIVMEALNYEAKKMLR